MSSCLTLSVFCIVFQEFKVFDEEVDLLFQCRIYAFRVAYPMKCLHCSFVEGPKLHQRMVIAGLKEKIDELRRQIVRHQKPG